MVMNRRSTNSSTFLETNTGEVNIHPTTSVRNQFQNYHTFLGIRAWFSLCVGGERNDEEANKQSWLNHRKESADKEKTNMKMVMKISERLVLTSKRNAGRVEWASKRSTSGRAELLFFPIRRWFSSAPSSSSFRNVIWFRFMFYWLSRWFAFSSCRCLFIFTFASVMVTSI